MRGCVSNAKNSRNRKRGDRDTLPLTSTSTDSPVQAEPAPLWQTLWLTFWPALILISIDQFTKLLVVAKLTPGESVRVLGDWVMFTFQLNAAGAMSIRLGPPTFYLIVTIAVAGFLGYLLLYKPLHRIARWSLLLVLAGAIGNVIDRIRIGAVIDFIDVQFFDFRLPAVHWGPIQVPGELMTRWPVFNVADAAVSVGIVLLIISTFLPQPGDAEAQGKGD